MTKKSPKKFRKKRGDTKIGTIEGKYGVDFGVRSDMRLDTYLKKNGLNSMSKALKEVSNR